MLSGHQTILKSYFWDSFEMKVHIPVVEEGILLSTWGSKNLYPKVKLGILNFSNSVLICGARLTLG